MTSSVNINKAFLVTDVIDQGSSMKLVVDGTRVLNATTLLATTFSDEMDVTGNTSTMNLMTRYVDDVSPFASSTFSTYLAKPINLNIPSNGVRVTMDINMPAGTTIEVYARYAMTTDYIPLGRKKWHRISSESSRNTGSKQFVETVWEATNVAIFNQIQVKVALKSDSTSITPKLKNFRVITLA